MGIHKNAVLTPTGREILVRRVLDEGQRPMSVATDMGLCVRTVRKWVARFLAEGVAGLQDRSSRPHRSPAQTPAALAEQIAVLRRQRRTGSEIAAIVGRSKATVFRILGRLGMNRLKSLEPAEPVRRYERDAPGEMIHIDIKKLGRFNRIGHRITGDRTGQSNSRGVGCQRRPNFPHFGRTEIPQVEGSVISR
ncbi:leucine zipper domain-containing protein, partial [Paramagnetospirillum marisnigri]|uniref:leucine zipper domain-containing protein n=1 Tax=Paramagnetospirillum marisnigri TaxID=1285242 RepID=UPI000AB115B6